MAKQRTGERQRSNNPAGRPAELGPTHLVLAQFPIELHKQLKAEAKRQKRSVSEVLREAAEQWLKRQ